MNDSVNRTTTTYRDFEPPRRPLRIRLRRLRLRLELLRHRLVWEIVASLGTLGAAGIFVGAFENRPIHFLTGLVQLAIAAALVWEEVRIDFDD